MLHWLRRLRLLFNLHKKRVASAMRFLFAKFLFDDLMTHPPRLLLEEKLSAQLTDEV